MLIAIQILQKSSDNRPGCLVMSSPERGDGYLCFCWPRVSCRKQCSHTNDLTLHLHQIHPRFYMSFL
ncbi:TPA: hypothetical protein I4G66_07705 [Enterobacter cloacae]|nr:hypothetical protein [Enterobacter cloacae]